MFAEEALDRQNVENTNHTNCLLRRDPPSKEGVFLSEAIEAQRAAEASLYDYPVHVVRRSTHKEPVQTPYATFYRETVRYTDGAIRLTTIAEPNESHFGRDRISPYAVVSGDPWTAGPEGLNKGKINRLAKLGYHVIWNHHQGRHAVWPTSRERLNTAVRFLSSKSVGKSAHHDHALLDDLAAVLPVDAQNVIREGYSRSAMSGKAFAALGERYSRKTVWLDVDAPCFAHEGSVMELLATAAEQIPSEIKGFAVLAIKHAVDAFHKKDWRRIPRLLGTLDPHLLNIAHETAWIRPLINGDAGIYGRAMPLDIPGVCVLYTQDKMSHHEDWEYMHSTRPNLAVVRLEGPHLAGAYPENLQKKYDRFNRLMEYMRQNGMSLSGVTPKHVLEPEQLLSAA